jgi:hypothetical protein
LISRSSSSTSGSGAGRRLRTWAVAAAVVCGTVGSSGAVAAETGATAAKAIGAASQSSKIGGPWLDSVTVVGLPAPATGPVTFNVTARNGIPWVYDPRVASGASRWQNLRRVPNSHGGYVTNISVALGDPALAPGAPATTFALKITARTGAGIHFTTCAIADATSDPFPTVGTLTNCTPWAAVPSTSP